MADLKQFNLPDVGEGLTEAEILTWHVKPGDQVKVNQIIVEIETAKSAVELPSPFEGVVTELYDVVALPGCRRPMAIGFKSDEIRRVVTVGPPPAG